MLTRIGSTLQANAGLSVRVKISPLPDGRMTFQHQSSRSGCHRIDIETWDASSAVFPGSATLRFPSDYPRP